MGWADAVLPRLSGLTKAMFAVGRFVTVDDAGAVFAVPNEVHRQRCQQKQPEVEAALADHFGVQVPLRLVVENGVIADDGPNPPDAHELDEGDLVGLRDAPRDTRTGVDRLHEAFPGSQLLEEDAP